MFSNKTHEAADKALKDGKIEQSIELYSKALLESPNDIDIISDRGVAYLNNNDKEHCFEDFNLAIELQPDYGYRYACRAFAKRHFKDIDGAVEDYEIAVKLDPEDTIAHNNLGLLLEEKGYKKEAERKFKRADKLSKMEDHLIDTIESMESVDKTEIQSDEKKTETPVSKKEKKNNSTKEFKKIFTSVEQFNQFMQFIKDGFKLKK